MNWFHSKNAIAHITICELKAADTVIEIIKNKPDLLCNTFEPFEVHLNSFGSYSNCAFFITTNEDSRIKVKAIMKKVHELLRTLKM